MTNMPEAKLAREAELCYAAVAMVTDYDCWHPDHDAVTVDMVVKTVQANAGNARALLKAAAPKAVQPPGSTCPAGCQSALEYALITAPEARDPELIKTLDAVAGRVLRGRSITSEGD
jgi:5'-methylthioadenosine phosphorylase